jgi:hypothetical protein
LGELLPTSDQIFPIKLKPLFEATESVSYKKLEEEVRDSKKNQFTAIKFKSKNTGSSVVV